MSGGRAACSGTWVVQAFRQFVREFNHSVQREISTVARAFGLQPASCYVSKV